MKDIKQFIAEAASLKVQFQGQEFEMDHIVKSNVHNDIYQATRLKEFTDDIWKDLKKQGVKYVLCFPPHFTQSNEKVDEFQIKMFIKSKKMSDAYKGTELYGLYDVKTHECVNKDKIKAYKVIRFE